jgi:hypothetical protein
MGETVAALVTAWTAIDWVLHLESWKEQFDLSTMDIKEILGDVPLDNPEIAGWLGGTVREAMKEVFGGILDEITEDLEAIRDRAKQEMSMRETSGKTRIVVGMATCGIAAGARRSWPRSARSLKPGASAPQPSP